ncbi:hypothetical protein WOLCODRAFT_20988 [Wolfiporia cocos MD-104 SS10]|uniref:Uncharacterized protein n=1 Tax=Wolfiporia cocos (strain MD-104) TaxID=742152 RepID=A0A2H3J5I0_WOLCO|nr:hypothetical protein WOLCODRAFT_20988 [Wolfiporia cocos MD-104 SS10]
MPRVPRNVLHNLVAVLGFRLIMRAARHASLQFSSNMVSVTPLEVDLQQSMFLNYFSAAGSASFGLEFSIEDIQGHRSHESLHHAGSRDLFDSVLIGMEKCRLFSALRSYATSNRCWIIALLTLVLGLVPAVANLARIVSGRYIILGEVFFYDTGSLTLPVFDAIEVASRLCVLTSDLLVICLTWYRRYPRLLFLLNAATMILYLTNSMVDLPVLINPLSTIAISRMLLDFGRASLRTGDACTDPQSTSQLSTVVVQPTANSAALQLLRGQWLSGVDMSRGKELVIEYHRCQPFTDAV